MQNGFVRNKSKLMSVWSPLQERRRGSGTDSGPGVKTEESENA